MTLKGNRNEQLEALRDRVIRDYGAAYELLEQPNEYKPNNKRSKSRATQRKREIAAQAIREYSTDDVLQAAHDLLTHSASLCILSTPIQLIGYTH